MFPGVAERIAEWLRQGAGVYIISHKTRYPYAGERHDLHAAAWDWLERQGFFDQIGLPREQVFFELTKEEKLRRIAEVGCTYFIDDLPEILTEPAFPAGVERILFDPTDTYPDERRFLRVRSWAEVGNVVPRSAADSATESRTTLPDLTQLLNQAGVSGSWRVEALAGGGNNKVFRVETATGPLLLKWYFRHPGDARDRLAGEFAFVRFAWDAGLRQVPRPFAADPNVACALYEFCPGRKLVPGEVDAEAATQAAEFVVALNRNRDAARHLPDAAEACFNLAAHLECVERRLRRLANIGADTEMDRAATVFLREQVEPAWQRVRQQVERSQRWPGRTLEESERWVSPSDFGFHNALRDDGGRLRFLDFEYAGWDDPAKLVCDFFCQPAVPVPFALYPAFVERLSDNVACRSAADSAPESRTTLEELRARSELLLPVYRLKWVTILLNEFLPQGSGRRQFAQPGVDLETRKRTQLDKATKALAIIVEGA
jgi:hypothetical protein